LPKQVFAHWKKDLSENLELEIAVKASKCFKAGIWGSIIAAVCCATPVLVIGLSLIGLAAFTPYLDYVLFPMLGLFLILAVYGWVKSKKPTCD
jgi:mercuric ion transport protein